jgi:diketogulonate reductase-like aldo/keto reductase
MLGPMPAVGLGTWPVEGEACRQLVAEAIDVGYRAIDTAQSYNNEAAVGAGIRDAGLPRDEIFLATKLWPDRLRAELVEPAVDESLDRLGLDFVDLLLIHWPNPDVPLAETLLAFDAVRKAGKARFIGVSNFTAALTREAAGVGVPLLCNQVEFHPFLDQTKVLDAARAAGLSLVAYAPVARGLVAASPVLAAIGRKHGRTATQVGLRWLVQQPGVGFAAKASSRARLKENLAVGDFTLSEAEMAEISALADGTRVVDLSIAPEWD